MKLNQELLNRIKEQIVFEQHKGEELHNAIDLFNNEDWPEVCRRYSEQIIKCDGCDGTGEREFYHETLGDSPCSCSLCEGKGYLN